MENKVKAAAGGRVDALRKRRLDGIMVIADLVLLLGLVAALLPRLTGFASHEWLSLVLSIALIVHFSRRVRPGAGLASAATKIRPLLSVLMIVALAACSVSGLMVSSAVLPTLGLYATGYYFWGPLHAASAKVFLALVLIHLALNAGVFIRKSKTVLALGKEVVDGER